MTGRKPRGELETFEETVDSVLGGLLLRALELLRMPLEQQKMDWLLQELAKTECPMTCPHGRPVVLRYSLKDIQRAFKRI